MDFSDRRARWFLVLLLLVALLQGTWGCSKNSTQVTMSADSFNSAPPDLQQDWKAAAVCVGKDDFLGAVTNLADIFSNDSKLNPDQVAQLNKAWEDLGNRAFEFANRGDQKATQAVLKMKDLKLDGRSSGR